MNVLVAVDLSDSSSVIIDYAKSLVNAFSGKIWLLHVAEPEPEFVGYQPDPPVMRDVTAKKFHEEHLQLQEYSQALRSGGLECTALLVQGATIETIHKEAEKLNINMIIVGSHGKGAISRLLLGSTSEGVIYKSSIPVLVIPTHGRN